MLRKKMYGEAGPPPDLATRLFTERIIYLVRPCVHPKGALSGAHACAVDMIGRHSNSADESSQGMPIDASVAELLTAQLFVLVQEAPDPIFFYINSTGIAVRKTSVPDYDAQAYESTYAESSIG